MDSEVPGDRRWGVANVHGAEMTWKGAIPDSATVVRGTDNGGANIVRFLFNFALSGSTFALGPHSGTRAVTIVAGSILNANRQVGSLVGIAAMGAVLHSTPDWDQAAALSFLTVGATYLLARLSAWRLIVVQLPQ